MIRECMSFLDNRAKLCLIKGCRTKLARHLTERIYRMITDYLLPTDYIAIGCLLTVLGTLSLALVWDVVASKIADHRSALEEQHWATTIREER